MSHSDADCLVEDALDCKLIGFEASETDQQMTICLTVRVNAASNINGLPLA
jgi:hypothetical protein